MMRRDWMHWHNLLVHITVLHILILIQDAVILYINEQRKRWTDGQTKEVPEYGSE
jgi:hypothetical protein